MGSGTRSSLLVAAEFEVFEAPHEQTLQPPPSFRGLDLRGAFKELTEYDLGLQPRQCGADAEVRALAESDVTLLSGRSSRNSPGSSNAKGPDLPPPITATAATRIEIQPHQLVSLYDVAVMAPKRRFVSQYLFEERTE